MTMRRSARRLPTGRSMDQCFEMFDLIHQVVVSRRALRRIVIEAVEDFAAENVRYLELRSTPRALERDGLGREDYIAEVVAALDECHARSDLDIQVRLILSINRNQPVEVAEETVALAIDWKFRRGCRYVVGIDLSGHSERPESEFHRFEPVLERARTAGLKLTVHFAEHFDNAEAARILDFRPDRVGHACCLSEALYDRMVKQAMPVEVCLTSNVCTLARYQTDRCCDKEDGDSPLCECGFASHPHRRLLTGEISAPNDPSAVYPLCISTDDHGVLDTTLSTEYERAARAFSLSEDRLQALAQAAVPFILQLTGCRW
jgi:adenosine deaminase